MKIIKDLPDLAFQTLEHVMFPVWVFSVETLKIITVNQATQDWLGFDLQTLQSMTIADLQPENQRTRIVEEVKKFKSATKDAGIWTIVGKKGEHYPAQISWSRARANGALVVVASIRNLNTLAQYQRGYYNPSTKKLGNRPTVLTGLSETEARLRSAEALLNLGSWEFDVDSQSLKFSDKMFEIYGLPGDAPAPLFDSYMDLVHPDDREEVLSTWSQFLEAPASGLEFQHRIIRADGGIAFVRGVGIRNHIDGKAIVFGCLQDMTLIKQAEDNLQRELQRRQLASHLVSLGSWQYKVGDTHVFWDNETAAIHDEPDGITPSVDNGISYYIPEDQDRIRDRFEACLLDGVPFDEVCQIVSAKGRKPWVRAIGEAVRDLSGTIVAVNGAFQDITDLIDAQEALKANEERFRLALREGGSAVWEWDVVTDIKWWSEDLQEIFGHQSDIRTNSKESLRKKYVHPEDLEGFLAAHERLASGHDSKFEETYRFRRGDGSWAIVEDRALAIRDRTGAVVRILGSMTDVTEKKQLEERLRQSQKMEVIGQLTGGVAHDFNNLLTVILGNSEIMEEELSAHPDLQKLAKMSLEAADRGAQLTSQLLAFSRKQPLEPKVINVAKLVQGMDGMLRRTLPESIDIEIVRSGGLWQIDADQAQLESAILNLALNARDAMPEGGCLTIEIANAMLDNDYIATEPELKAGQYVVITVTDTGHGIPREIIGKVFDPFFTTKDVGKGSGLGLSMVFGFVKQSGGHVRVYSEVGDGTAFKLYFPRSRGEGEHTAMPQTRRKIVGGFERVLVVEDDPAVREYVSAQLRGLGYEVYEASSGKHGIEVLLRIPEIDLLFTDVVMPGGISGRELAEFARKIRPEIAILFTSGYTENSIVHEGRLDLGIKLLSKPYRRQQLAAKVREALSDHDPSEKIDKI